MTTAPHPESPTVISMTCFNLSTTSGLADVGSLTNNTLAFLPCVVERRDMTRRAGDGWKLALEKDLRVDGSRMELNTEKCREQVINS
jgi:hypothetical protein